VIVVGSNGPPLLIGRTFTALSAVPRVDLATSKLIAEGGRTSNLRGGSSLVRGGVVLIPGCDSEGIVCPIVTLSIVTSFTGDGVGPERRLLSDLASWLSSSPSGAELGGLDEVVSIGADLALVNITIFAVGTVRVRGGDSCAGGSID